MQDLTLSLCKPPPVPTGSGEDVPNTGEQEEGVIKGIPRLILVVRVPEGLQVAPDAVELKFHFGESVHNPHSM